MSRHYVAAPKRDYTEQDIAELASREAEWALYLADEEEPGWSGRTSGLLLLLLLSPLAALHAPYFPIAYAVAGLLAASGMRSDRARLAGACRFAAVAFSAIAIWQALAVVAPTVFLRGGW